MGDTVELSTHNSVEITSGFYKVSSNAVSFEVKGYGPVFVGLASEPGRDVKYWIGINGNRRTLMVDGLDRDLNESWVTSSQPNCTLNTESFIRLWISWHSGRLQVGDGTNTEEPIISEQLEHVVNYVTFISEGPCDFKIEMPPISLVKLARQPKLAKPLTDGHPEWVKTDAQLPDESIIGGHENGELLYIIRGRHRGSLTPGKFVPSEGVAYICWGGETHVMEEFEVLCGHNFQWIPTHGCLIPKNALIAGRTELGENLHIGRTYYQGHLIVGKVPPSDRVCYIPYGDSEIPIKNYEILTVPDSNVLVLQGYNFQWTRTTSWEIPKNALIGGYSETGDTLYVGRAYHDGQLIVGKVQPTHKVCYLPFRDREIPKVEYEILTVPGLNEHVANDHFVNELYESVRYDY